MICFFDTANTRSDKWYTDLRAQCPSIPVICLANKIDLDMSVTERQFKFPTLHDLPFFFVSANTGVNVVRACNEAIRLAISARHESADQALEELMRLIQK